MLFAFYGRVSTEDHQDEGASHGWQLRRARQLIEPHGGLIVTEFFDAGQSRSLPWRRRPQAAQLLTDLTKPDRGWGAIVVGESARAFYGNQFSNTFPVLEHYGVELWVPDVGGKVESDSEAHDMLMTVFGGMAKGERNRIKLRVKTAMADLTEREGRFLGGRPPYGYRLANIGPHPHPEKAAAGIQLHRLEPDPVTAPVVQEIFADYLAGAGYRAIAQRLTDAGVPSPSAYDADRNRHRSGRGWNFGAVRAILENQRYTGTQVWGRQPRFETLLDTTSPQDGYITVQRWADRDKWIHSEQPAHEPLVDELSFQRVQAMVQGRGADRQRKQRSPKADSPYLMSGLIICELCGRKMSGHRSERRLGYQCRIRSTYALPPNDPHPKSVWVPESKLVAATFDWLGEVFSPENRERVLEQVALAGSEPPRELAMAANDLKDALARIDRLASAVENGVFTADEVAAKLGLLRERRERAKAVIAAGEGQTGRLDAGAIADLLDELGGLVAVADLLTDDERKAIFAQSNLSVRYHSPTRTARFVTDLGRGVSVRVEGGT
jgi:site-specific DNA recombinase